MSLTLDFSLARPLWDQLGRAVMSLVARMVRAPAGPARLHQAAQSLPRARQNASGFSAFQHAVIPQFDAAYNFARFLARDADAAQDIVQEAMLRAYRGFGGYRGGDPRAWLFSIVRNCFHDWQLERRRRGRHETESFEDGRSGLEADEPFADFASEEDTPEAALIRKREAEAVRGVISSLPRPLREILVLRELEDLSYRDIAEVTGLPIGTVMSRLARARDAFAEAWAHGGGRR